VSPQPEAVAGGSERAAPDDAAGSGVRETVPTGPASGLPEIPVMLDTQWYTARQVDRRPELMTPALPSYPEEARRQGIQGSVVIEVHIDEYGRVHEIAVLEANPPGVFEAAVLDVYGKAQFSPALLHGRPVRYIGKYRVSFELD
jgi:TonB family protein